MHQQKNPGTALVASLSIVLLSVAAPASAAWFNTLDYFETEYPSACTAAQLNNPGAWYRIDLDESGPCADDVYHFTKGHRAGYNVPNSQQDAGLWGTESFIVNYHGGWLAIKMMNERGVFCSPESACIPDALRDDHDPGDAYHRVFRDTASQQKGALWMPVYVNGSFSATTTFDLEYWRRASDHRIMCVGNDQVYQEYPSVSQTRSVSGPYTKTGWMQDKRSVSPNKSTWHDVEYIKLTDAWGSVREEFWYGRWFDPVANGYRGLGLVRWAWIENGAVTQKVENRLLVDCNVVTDCTGICPP